MIRRVRFESTVVVLVVVSMAALLTTGNSFATPNAPPSEETLNSVFIVGVVRADKTFENVGTAWTIQENWLATNAHVAEGLIAMSAENPGSHMVARRGAFDTQELVLGEIRMHPAYSTWNSRMQRMIVGTGQNLKQFEAKIPIADVAVMEVTLGDAGRPLTCCDMADDSHEPELGEDITYIGYPSENISGFATAHVVRGNLTAVTDFFYMPTDWADCHLLHFAGPIAGGASGSPVFDSEGRVIGLLSAGEFGFGASGERITQSFSYAQRVDLAQELLDGTWEENQKRRNRIWLRRAEELFVRPDDLINGRVATREGAIGLAGDSHYQVVSDREEKMPLGTTEKAVRVVMEPGYAYGFLAVAHDGTDLDIFVRGADGIEYGSDTFADQFPEVWLDPVATRTDVHMVLYAAEPLVIETPVTARVVRLPAASIPIPATETRFFEETVTASAQGAANWAWTIDADPGFTYICRANSVDLLDIDLRLLKDGVVIAEDVLLDSFPRVDASGYEGELRLELVLPATTQVGQQFDVTIDTTPYDATAQGDIFEAQRLHTETVTADRDGTAAWTWTIQAQPNLIYTCNANSPDQLDIDLKIYQNDALLAEDVLVDWYPRVEVSGYGGELVLELILPEGTRTGQQFEVTIDVAPVGG